MTVKEVVAKWAEVCRLEQDLQDRYGYMGNSPSIGCAHDYGYADRSDEEKQRIYWLWDKKTGSGTPEDWVRLCGLIQEIHRAIGGQAVILPGNKILRVHDEYGDLVEDEVFTGDEA